jgi:hypothetical protein
MLLSRARYATRTFLGLGLLAKNQFRCANSTGINIEINQNTQQILLIYFRFLRELRGEMILRAIPKKP